MIEGLYISLFFLVYVYFIHSHYRIKWHLFNGFIVLIVLILIMTLTFYEYIYASIILGVLLILGYLLLTIKEKSKWLFIVSLLMNVLVFLIIYHYSNFNVSFILSFSLAIILTFMLSHLNKQVSVFFIGLFFTAMGLIGYIGINYCQETLYIPIVLSVVLWLLSESNHHYIRINNEQRLNDYQNKLMIQHVAEVEHIYETMRGWRHDYHNHMQTLKVHLAFKQVDLMEKYLHELENDLNSIHTLVESGNTNLDAILNSKLSLAAAKDIDIHIKANVPNKLLVNDIDLCVVIGNLLDNAIESCEAMNDDDKKFIRVYIGIFKKQLYISVTNSTKELVRKLDEAYITNKRGNHGHGLKRIDLVVKKYEGYINRKNEPGVFVTEIMLPL